MPATTELRTFGLRFKRTDVPILRDLANRVQLGEIPGDLATYQQAMVSAALNEPLEVTCTPDEAQLLAHGYALNGTSLPTIDELTHHRR